MRGSIPLFAVVLALLPSILHAQEKPKGFAEFNQFNANKRDGWEWDEDERLDDLLEQLQEKELALQQVDALAAKLSGRKASAKGAETMAWRSTNRMDLKGGGPISWDAFYGRNAEKFFYHPVDRNTTYHTTTALQQVQPTAAGGVPGNQGVPAHQRPPQFDYIYRGYEQKQAKAQADAKEIASKLDALKQRRRQLEREVVLLWIKIAFRVQDRDKVAEKPVLRWAATPKDAGSQEAADRAAALNEASQLLATALLFNEKQVETDADRVFGTVSDAIQKNRKKFEDSLLKADAVQEEAEDRKKPIGQYVLLARKLEDNAKSLSEGYRGWKDGDENDDEPTKYEGLGRVQESVVNYSQILLALNELVDVMKKEWGLRINTQGTEFTPTWDVVYAPPKPIRASPPNTSENRIRMIATGSLDGWSVFPAANRPTWNVANGVLTCIGDGSSLLSEDVFEDFDFSLEFMLPPRCNSGIYLRNKYEIQFLDTQWRSPRNEMAKPAQATGAIWGYAAPAVLAYVGPNKWNTLEGTLKGDSLTVKLNGKLIHSELRLNRKASGESEPVTTAGPFLIQYHTDTVGMKIRNFYVTKR